MTLFPWRKSEPAKSTPAALRYDAFATCEECGVAVKKSKAHRVLEYGSLVLGGWGDDGSRWCFHAYYCHAHVKPYDERHIVESGPPVYRYYRRCEVNEDGSLVRGNK